jgi:hypothetical protein
MLKDAQLNSMIVNALRLSPKFADLIREGYFQDSDYGNHGEWTKDYRIEEKFVLLASRSLLCPAELSSPSEIDHLISNLHDNSSDSHEGVAGILAKAMHKFL